MRPILSGAKICFLPVQWIQGKFSGMKFAIYHRRVIVTAKFTTILETLVLLFFFFPSSTFAYEEIAVVNGGTIKGSVKLAGKFTKPPPLDITKFKEVCRDVPNETLVIGPGQGIRYAVVSLEGIARGQAVERETIHELDNSKCRFVPHVVAASVGQFLLFKNSDPILHTAHALFQDGQPQFNVGLYPGRVSRKPLLSAGILKIQCEVHLWMSAYVVVTEHPYHAVTDIYGDYQIRDVPPGVYRLKLWHESLGTQERQVEVKAGGVSEVDFTLSQVPGAKK
jgi:plastocyanin